MSRRRTRPASQRAGSSTRAETHGRNKRYKAVPDSTDTGEREARVMSVVLDVIYIALMCFLIVLIFRLVMDYVFQFARSWQPGKAMVVVLEATYTVTDPPLKLLRRFIPPLRLGGVALDLSFFVLMIIVYILISVAQSFL